MYSQERTEKLSGGDAKKFSHIKVRVLAVSNMYRKRLEGARAYKLLRTAQIKSLLYSPYYAEACNKWRSPFPRLSAWATQLRRNVAPVSSRWRHCADLTDPGIEPQTSRTDSVRLAAQLTGRSCVELPTQNHIV